MRITRLVASVATAALVVGLPVAIGSDPASAVTTLASTVTIDPLTSGTLTYKDDLSISGEVTDANGDGPASGTVSLQIATPDSPAYVTIATSADSSFFIFDEKAVGNATYQVVYSGGADYSSNVITPSVSAPLVVAAERKVKLRTKGLKVLGKVKPGYKHRTVKILKFKSKKKTVKFARLKTNKKGQFTFRAPNKIGFKFVVVIPASAEFAGTAAAYRVF